MEPTREVFVDGPRRQFVEEPREEALRGARPESDVTNQVSARESPDGAQRFSQSPNNVQQPETGSIAVLHQGRVGNSGSVRVTTGERRPGISDPNLIGLEYEDQSSGGPSRVQRTHWLQFVWIEMVCTTVRSAFNAVGSIPAGGTSIPLTIGAPFWQVDTLAPTTVGSTRPIIPWYDYPAQPGAPGGVGGETLRTPTSLKIFDAPGPGPVVDAFELIRSRLSEGPNVGQIAVHGSVTEALLAFHFDTYLVQGFSVLYHIPWTASFVVSGLNRPEAVQRHPRVYTVGSAGPVARLPRVLYNVLIRDYPAYGGVAPGLRP